MTYSSVIFQPAIGTVGTECKAVLRGSPASTNHPALVYAYVQSAPANSKLKTLDQLQTMTEWISGSFGSGAYPGPLALGTERESLRLNTSKDDGRPVFTPDVPGLFLLRYYDVSEYHFRPTFQGQHPTGANLAAVDNELAALPAYAGGTAQAPSLVTDSTVGYWVAETRSREFGAAPHKATLSVTGYDDKLDATNEDRAVLKPGPTPLAQGAMLVNDVRAAMLSIKQLSATVFDSLTIQNYASLFTAFNRHISLGANQTVHTIPDATNTLASTTCTTLATAIAVLNDTRTKYAAHRVLTAGVTHNAADNLNVTTAPACTDFGTASALFADLRDKMFAHAINNGAGTAYHISDADNGPVDGAAYEWLEAPFPGSVAHMVVQVNRLAAFYEAHRVKVIAKTHQVVDVPNLLTGYSFSSNDGLAKSLNQLADALTRHIANKLVDGSAAPFPYHALAIDPPAALSSNAEIPVRANGQDPGSIQHTAEWIAYALEQHALDAHPHNDFAQWGATTHNIFFFDSLSARLLKAWADATHVGPTLATGPDFTNQIATLKGAGWL